MVFALKIWHFNEDPWDCGIRLAEAYPIDRKVRLTDDIP